nr:hypothetical protein [candidate division Zixibacteria bacterium]
MLEGSFSRGNSKKNIYCFILILFYTVYGFVGINPPKLAGLIENMNLPQYPDYLLILVGILIIALMLFGIIKKSWSASKCGFSFGKSFWIIFAIVVAILALIVIQNTQVLTITLFLELIPVFLFFLGGELLLRVLLINRLRNIFADNKYWPGIIMIISGVLFTLVYCPFNEITLTLLYCSVLISMFYYYYQSILLLMAAEMLFYLDFRYMTIMAIIVLLFYFPVALIGRYYAKEAVIIQDAG